MRPALMLLPLLLAGCATTMVKRTQVESALLDAGLSRGMAACMAQPMAEKLSVRQLRELERVAGLRRVPIGQLTLGELADALTRTDAETAAVVTRAGMGCVLRG